MNKETNGLLTYDSKTNRESNTISYFLGGKDTLFKYRLTHDTLYMTSINFENEHKAIKISNCTPVKDWFYLSPISFDLPRTEQLFGEQLGKQSLSTSLVIGKIEEEIKFSLFDEISDNKEDLERAYSKHITTLPRSQRSYVFADLYVDRKIKLIEIEWIIESLKKSGFSRVYLVYEVKHDQKLLYRKIELKDLKSKDITIAKLIKKI